MSPRDTIPPAAGRTYARVPQRGDLARRSLVAVVVVAAAVFAVLAQLGENGIVTWWRLRGEAGRLERRVTELEARNAAMAGRLDELATDREALEALAREKYGMRRADEEVLTVLQPPADPEQDAEKPARVP